MLLIQTVHPSTGSGRTWQARHLPYVLTFFTRYRHRFVDIVSLKCLISSDRLAAAEAEMIILVAMCIHHPAAVPIRGSPAAPVFVRIVGIKYKPASFHLRIAQLLTAPTRHLALVKREVHMFSSVSMLIIDAQRTSALWKRPCGERIRSALGPAPAFTPGRFLTGGCADSLAVGRTPIGPSLLLAVRSVVSLAHPFNRHVGGNVFSKVKALIRGLKGARTGSFPFMGVTEPLAHGPA